MDGLALNLANTVLGGGPQALAAVLLLFILVLIRERLRLMKQIKAMDEVYERMVTERLKAVQKLAEGLTEMRRGIAEFRQQTIGTEEEEMEVQRRWVAWNAGKLPTRRPKGLNSPSPLDGPADPRPDA